MTEALPELRDPLPGERPGMQPTEQPAAPAAATEQPVEPKPAPLTPEERAERARLAAKARWAKQFDWETCSMPEGLAKLAELRAETEKGALVMERRSTELRVNVAKCYECGKDIDIGAGRFAGSRTRKNPENGQDETAYACCAACFMQMTRKFTHYQAQRA